MNRSAAMLNFFDSTKSKITASVRHLLITHPLVIKTYLHKFIRDHSTLGFSPSGIPIMNELIIKQRKNSDRNKSE